MSLRDRLLAEADAFTASIAATLTEAERSLVAERALALAGLAARAAEGETGLEEAIASHRRSLNLIRTSVGVRLGESVTARLTRVLTGVFSAALGALA